MLTFIGIYGLIGFCLIVISALRYKPNPVDTQLGLAVGLGVGFLLWPVLLVISIGMIIIQHRLNQQTNVVGSKVKEEPTLKSNVASLESFLKGSNYDN